MGQANDRLEAIFDAAAELSGPERELYLARACRGDVPLRQRIEKLLRALDRAGGFLTHADPLAAAGGPPAASLVELPDTRPAAVPEKPGDRIGRYKLLQQIGEGGCGVVYMAEQEEPVRRRVALKVIKLGMDTKSVIARFEAERQALALMDHPNIAKVLDAGTTGSGRPYFVMELVRGIKITDYCDQNKVSTRGRLDLFIQVCHAIQHAHQKGIIHRDIKPSNVLVTVPNPGSPGVPVVIDFGIAKATEQRLTDKTLFTAFEQFMGTPAYTSPEQAGMSRLDVDTRSDIYSLGVLLYELLTGKTPFDSKELLAAGLDEMRRTIREKEPARPSTRLNTLQGEELTTTATRRATQPPKLIHQVQGDLDWIVMKCLEKDRMRRYETADGLALDIERHLNHKPVDARPQSTAYRVQKFARRNKFAVTAASAVAAALITGLGVSSWLFVQEQVARRRAVSAEQTQRELRQEAEANATKAQAEAYAADINLAQRALGANDPGLAWTLLQRHRPVGKPETLSGRPAHPTVATDLRHWEWRYLWQFCQSDEILTLCRESSLISSVQVSPDGKRLAVRRGDGQIVLWDWAARRRLPDLPESLMPGQLVPDPFGALMLRDIAFLPFDSLLAFGTTDADGQTEVVLWDTNTATERTRFPYRATIASLAPSRDGRLLAIFDVARQVTIQDLESNQERAHLEVSPPAWFPRLASYGGVVEFSPDGQRLAVGDNDGTIHLWRWQSGVDMKIAPQTPANGVLALAWSPTEPLLASAGGSEGGTIRLWNPLTGAALGELRGHTDWTGALAFSTNGQFLASASADRTVRVWRVADRTESRCFRGHRDQVWTVAFLPDGKTLASGDKEGTVRFWSLEAATNRSPSHEILPEKILPAMAGAPVFAPDGRTFLTACQDGRVRLWSLQPVRKLEQLGWLGTNIYTVALSADGRWLATADWSGLVRIWDWPLRRALTNLPMPSAISGILSFTPRGRHLWGAWLLTDHARAARIWETGTWREMPPLPIDSNGNCGGLLSPDEKLFAACYMSGEVKLWSFPDGTLVDQFRAHGRGLVGVAFTPDGRTLASAGADGFLQLWDVLERRPLTRLQGLHTGVCGPAFSSDGRRLAVMGRDAQEAVKLWDMATLRELIALPAKGLYFGRTFFSPDGNTLVAVDADSITHFWHAPSFADIEALENTKN
jgi:eukaryotic-like serine/threonine-protein kinase